MANPQMSTYEITIKNPEELKKSEIDELIKYIKNIINDVDGELIINPKDPTKWLIKTTYDNTWTILFNSKWELEITLTRERIDK